MLTIILQGIAVWAGYFGKNIRFLKRPQDYAVNGLALLLTFNIASAAVMPEAMSAVGGSDASSIESVESVISQTSLVDNRIVEPIKARMIVPITGYSSTPDQTDDTPFITATGDHVDDGIVAANFLPFNTHIKIPKLFGNKIFVVKDRMAKRFSDRVDIWFADRSSALKFGLRHAEIEVL